MKLKKYFLSKINRSDRAHDQKTETTKVRELYSNNKKLIDIESVVKQNNFFEKIIR